MKISIIKVVTFMYYNLFDVNNARYKQNNY